MLRSPTPPWLARALASTLCLALLWGSSSAASAAPPAQPTLGLTEGIPSWELATVGGVLLLDAALVGAGWLWADNISPTIGAPSGSSLDRRVSEAFSAGRDDPLLWGAPDAGGWVLSLLPVALYGSSSALLAARGSGWMGSGDNNPHLRLAAYAEAVSITLLLSQTAKLAVGRTRPRVVLYQDGPASGDSEAHLSFFSMHTALSFTAATFLALDQGARLRAGPGVALAVLLYGAAALVGFSRIHDQAHFLTDVLVGAAVGLTSGALVYLRHFDMDGRARRGVGDDAVGDASGRPRGLAVRPMPA